MGCLSGEWYETEFNVFFLKEPGYTIIVMSTFSYLTDPEGQKEERRMVNGEVVKFENPKVVADH